MAPSDDDISELLDEDALPPEYPLDRPIGVNQYGTTPQEERIDEPLQERALREDHGGVPPDRPVLLLDETEDGLGAAPDLDAGETGDAMLGEAGEGSYAGDDFGPSLGTPSSDLAADRVPLAAEEAAVHIVEPDDLP